MTISSTTVRQSHAGAGTTGPFAFGQRFLADADLLVIKEASDGTETVLTITTDYTVSGAGDASGGSVTTVATVDAGQTLHIINDPVRTQTTDYTDNSAFPAETTEAALDRLTLITQRLDDRADRALRKSETGGDFAAGSVKITGVTGGTATGEVATFDSISSQVAAAETAQTAAETAQGLAEGAQTASETAQGAAETAQGLAETAQSNAQSSASAAAASASAAAAALGGVGWRYEYQTPTTDADPGAGHFRLNNATLASVTEIYIDNQDLASSGLAEWWASIDNYGGALGKGQLTIQGVTNDSHFAVYTITAIATPTGYRRLTVTHVDSEGSWTADDEFLISFQAAGQDGAGVVDGSQGDITISGAPSSVVYTINSNTIDTAQIVNRAVGAFQIAENAVDSFQIAADAVGASELDLSISPTWTSAHQFDGNVDIAENLRHTGNTGTRLQFETDTINLNTNGATRASLTNNGFALGTGSRVDTIETTLTDDDTHLPTSGAVVDYVAANGGGAYAKVNQPTGFNSATQFLANNSGADFSDIILISLQGVSLDGNGNILLVLGDAAGWYSSGYVSRSGDGSSNYQTSTAGFIMYVADAARDLTAEIVLRHYGSNKWGAVHFGHSENAN
ncbi:MAG: hypothetical protein AAFR28_17535, partial [Pseudomonadota bacterium]